MVEYDYREIIAAINEVENKFPIDQLTYKKLNIWPLIKNNFNFEQINRIKIVSQSKAQKNFKQKVGDVILAFTTWQKARNNKIEEPVLRNKMKTVYLSYSSHRNLLLNGKYFNVHADSFAATSNESKELQILEFTSHNIVKTPPYKEFINGDYLRSKAEVRHKKQNFFKYIAKIFSKKENYHGFPNEKFSKFINDLNNDLQFDFEHSIYQVDFILCLKEEFIKFFKKHKTKEVYFPVYYNLESYAAILACKALNINCTEIQHGYYSSALYKFPPANYELLPDQFFSWDAEQAKLINQWSQNCGHHNAITFGIPYLTFWNKNKGLFVNDSSILCQQLIASQPNKIHILYVVSDYFESFIPAVIKATENFAYWHIRKHPRVKHSNEDTILQELKDSNCSNFEMTNTTNAPLYSILELMQLHITSYSSTICEANVLNIPTFIINKSGEYLFEQEYKNNPNVSFLLTGKDLLDGIKNKFNKN